MAKEGKMPTQKGGSATGYEDEFERGSRQQSKQTSDSFQRESTHNPKVSKTI